MIPLHRKKTVWFIEHLPDIVALCVTLPVALAALVLHFV